MKAADLALAGIINSTPHHKANSCVGLAIRIFRRSEVADEGSSSRPTAAEAPASGSHEAGPASVKLNAGTDLPRRP